MLHEHCTIPLVTMPLALDQVPTASQLQHVHQLDNLPLPNHSHGTNVSPHLSTQQLIPHLPTKKTLTPLMLALDCPQSQPDYVAQHIEDRQFVEMTAIMEIKFFLFLDLETYAGNN